MPYLTYFNMCYFDYFIELSCTLSQPAPDKKYSNVHLYYYSEYFTNIYDLNDILPLLSTRLAFLVCKIP